MKLLLFIIGSLLLSLSVSASGQEIIKNSSVTGICYAGTKVNRIYIPPPKEFFFNGSSKSGGSVTVYYKGFTSQAKAAVDYAASILKSLLPPDTRLTVTASWQKITTAGVLAQSGISGFAAGWGIDALNPMAFYPVALAEKIAGKSLNDDIEGDISLSINSSINWYFGTDGQTPSQKYDLVTVALHEICHGLGFFDSFSSDGTNGYYGRPYLPMIYDTFVENNDRQKLTDTLKFFNGSPALAKQLTGNQLYFNGTLLKNYSILNNYTNLRAKLYVPSKWDNGSSVSHLDESTTLQSNSLMTPFIDLGEAIHDPGKYTFSILGDMGWINTRIIHIPYRDTESHLNKVQITAEIKSDTLYNHNKVGVVFSFDNFQTSDSLFLTSPSSDNFYITTINIPSYNSALEYYLIAEDCFLRRYRLPSLYKDYNILKNRRFRRYIGIDTVKPIISHAPVDFVYQTIDTLRFLTNVTDNLGVDSVYLEYKINNGPSKFLRLKNIISDIYKAEFSAEPLFLKGYDSIQYKIFAVDTAKNPNIGVLPKSGFFVTHVEKILSTIQKYSTDFSNAVPDFFNKGFQISKPNGFNSFCLNSKHPYDSPEDNDKTIEYTAVLRHPMIFSESGMMFSYNEVVLVEPGEEGSVFGSSDFYDYVIVEGSKDFGKNWFPLIDGYDSRLVSSWETDYKKSLVGNNSTFTPDESMLKKHVFLYSPTDNISPGDTLLVRFRLFSDPFANGWGWVIDDLSIGPLVDAAEVISKLEISLYPNPGNGVVKIRRGSPGSGDFKSTRYSVFSASGLQLVKGITLGSSEDIVDISHYPAGMYFIALYLEDKIITTKYILIR